MRVLIGSSGLLISMLGILLIICLDPSQRYGQLVGYYFTQAAPTAFVALLSLISSNMAGYTKKTTVAAMYLIAYCTGNIIGPQMFRPKDAPRYVPAEIAIVICWFLCFVDMLFIHWYTKRRNAQKAALRAAPDYVKRKNIEWMDLTDRENPDFVYTL